MDKNAKKKNVKSNKVNVIIAIQIVIIVILAVAVGVLAGQKPVIITNFEECDALRESITTRNTNSNGGKRVCKINGERFYEEGMIEEDANNESAGSLSSAEEAYMGLTEEEAVAKAESLNVPVRILERDGQFFPMTMDLVHGRVNLTINNNKVTAVQIEDAQVVEEE